MRPVVEQYGEDPLKEYRAVKEDVGGLDLGHLGKLRVSGRDRVRYLHNMLSNDIKGLGEGRGCYAALLTHQGRMEADAYALAFAEELWLESSLAGKDRLFQTLTKYIVSDIVTVEDWTEKLGVLSLQGPRARERMEEVAGISLASLSTLEHRTIPRSSGDWVVVRRDRTGCDGYDLWVPAGEVSDLWPRWLESGRIPPVGLQALNWLRTEAGIPWYGVDMDEKTLPMEMGLDHAISMTKGCYRGQEIVARITHRGHLDRRLGAITIRHQDIPAGGAEVFSGGSKIGAITSAIASPRLQQPLALAVVKTEFLKPGTPVEVAYGDATRPGEVVALPLK
jgi:folate-binding protein YgfZ